MNIFYQDPQIPEISQAHVYEKLKEKKNERKIHRFCEISHKKQSYAISFAVWILIIIITGKSVYLHLRASMYKSISAIIISSKFQNPVTELTPGSLISSIKNSHNEIIESQEESFDTEDEFNTSKDFKVVRVDKDSDNDEDVEIIKISCCPRIRFNIKISSKLTKSSFRITSLGLLSQLYPSLIGVYTKINTSSSSRDRRQVYRMAQPDAELYISKPAPSPNVDNLDCLQKRLLFKK